MVYLGCHLSSGKGFRAMVRTAESIGADTFAYFTRNPRGSKGKDPDKNDIAAALAEMKEQGFGKLVAHGAYTMNLCTADQRPGLSPLPCWRTICGGWRTCRGSFTISIPAAMWARGRKRAWSKLPRP